MKYFPLIFIVILLLNNCHSTSTATAKEGVAKIEAQAEGLYLITSLYGEDVSEHKLTMKFDTANKRITGFSGCNTYSCSYTNNIDSFTTDPAMSSKIYCAKTADIEKKFFTALSEIKRKELSKDAGSIKLLNETTEIIEAIKKPE